MTDNVNKTAKDGFKEGSFYDHHRPEYTDELASHVVKNLYKGTIPDIKFNVLEIGAGTGKFTRKILPDLEECCYLATDQSEEFLAVLRKQSPTVETRVCSAAAIPLPDHSVQNIICAQCFHWFADNDSLKEMTRVLVPGGRLMLLWNNRICDEDWCRNMNDVLTLYHDADTPRYNTREWQTVVDSFKPLKCIDHRYLPGIDMKGDKEFVLNFFASISVIIKQKEEDKKTAVDKIRAVLDVYFKNGEEIHVPHNSEFYCAEKL